LAKVILKDQYSNNVIDIPSTSTFIAKMSGNNMVPLNLNVELVANDNSGESKLFISILDDQKTLNQQSTMEVFSRLVPAKNYKITVEKMVSGVFSSSGQMTIELVGQDRGAGNVQFVHTKTWLPEGTTLVSTAGQKGSIRFVLR